MPGEFIDTVHIYQCGTHPDGTAIMCSEILIQDFKIPFPLPKNSPYEVGWQEPHKNDVQMPLAALVETMKGLGITMSYDLGELERRWGTHPDVMRTARGEAIIENPQTPAK